MTFKLLALGIVAFVVSLIVSAPAHLAARFLPPGISATYLQGTLLSGQARRFQVQGFNLGAVTWDLQPLLLLLGRIQSDVSVNQPNLRGRGNVAVGFNRVQIGDARLAGDTRLLAPYLANYGVAVSGRYNADIEALKLNDEGPQAADGNIVWRDARLESPALLSLGDVNVTLKQDDDTMVAVLKNTGEQLRVTGGAQVRPGWKYAAQMKIEPTAATPQSVRDTLPLLGQPDSRGAITLNQQGTLTTVKGLL